MCVKFYRLWIWVFDEIFAGPKETDKNISENFYMQRTRMDYRKMILLNIY